MAEERYLKVLIELLIMYSPAIPHFTNECWSALKDNLKTDYFDTVIFLVSFFVLLLLYNFNFLVQTYTRTKMASS